MSLINDALLKARAQAALRDGQIDLREALDRVDEVVARIADRSRELADDALDLAPFLNLQFAPAVAEFDHGEWLYINRRPGRRSVVDDAAHGATGLGLHW